MTLCALPSTKGTSANDHAIIAKGKRSLFPDRYNNSMESFRLMHDDPDKDTVIFQVTGECDMGRDA